MLRTPKKPTQRRPIKHTHNKKRWSTSLDHCLVGSALFFSLAQVENALQVNPASRRPDGLLLCHLECLPLASPVGGVAHSQHVRGGGHLPVSGVDAQGEAGAPDGGPPTVVAAPLPDRGGDLLAARRRGIPELLKQSELSEFTLNYP